MLSKSDILQKLNNHVAKVTFTKADGTKREMCCTLMQSMVPERKLEETHVPRKQNDEVVAVWDIDNNGWRSFRLDSIINIQYIGVDYAASA